MPFATSSVSYSCFNLSIPAHGVFGHCIALDSQADQDLDQQRLDRASIHLAPLNNWLTKSKWLKLCRQDVYILLLHAELPFEPSATVCMLHPHCHMKEHQTTWKPVLRPVITIALQSCSKEPPCSSAHCEVQISCFNHRSSGYPAWLKTNVQWLCTVFC